MPGRPLVILLLAALALTAGCANLPVGLQGEELRQQRLPGLYEVVGRDVELPMDDSVAISATVYVPAGEAGETFPAVVLVHGWGGSRHGGPGEREGTNDRVTAALAGQLARKGFVTLAYDVRGFGESGGTTQLAGAREVRDLQNLITWLETHTPSEKGNVGVTGFSYGGGHSFLIGLKDPRVKAVAPWYGWVDLADGLIPDRVPKHGWVNLLLVYGLPSARGEYDPVLYDWYLRGVTRTDVDPVIEGLRKRSVVDELANFTTPVLLVEGLGETLFPQTWEAYTKIPAPKRIYTYDGGHGSFDEEAWNLTERWFRHWLRGEDTGVMNEPAARVYAPWSGDILEYDAYPAPGAMTVRFSTTPDGNLVTDDPGSATADLPFVNTLASGRFDDPAGLTDRDARARSGAPPEARAAPAGEVARFVSEPFEDAAILFGSPRFTANFTSRTEDLQVAARLYDLAPDGTVNLLSRGGADLSPVPAGETVSVDVLLTRNHWRIEEGHALVLEIAASDLSYTEPLPRPFAASVIAGGPEGAGVDVPLIRTRTA